MFLPASKLYQNHRSDTGTDRHKDTALLLLWPVGSAVNIVEKRAADTCSAVPFTSEARIVFNRFMDI